MKFGEKIAYMRRIRRMTQQDLANGVGISKRAVAAYETDGVIPRYSTLKKLAKVLHVSYDYLQNDEVNDPNYGIDRMNFTDQAGGVFGAEGAWDVNEILAANEALFAGGGLDQNAKDIFFQAVTKAYIASKLEAMTKFGRKKAPDGSDSQNES